MNWWQTLTRKILGSSKEASMSKLDTSRTALLIIDPQNDFLSEGGVGWDLVGDGVKNTKVVEHRWSCGRRRRRPV